MANLQTYGKANLFQRTQRLFNKKVWYKAYVPLPDEPSEEEQ